MFVGKMKPLVADKLGVSLLGELNEKEENVTTLSSVPDREEREIDDCKRAHWHQCLPKFLKNQLQNL